MTDIGSSSQSELQEEILGEMAQALGTTADKLKVAIREVQSAAERVQKIDREDRPDRQQRLNKILEEYQKARVSARNRRQNLLIHRQACGFVVDNHKVVYKHYPIPPKMELDFSGSLIVHEDETVQGQKWLNSNR